MYDLKTGVWKCLCGAADHYSCLCEPVDRVAQTTPCTEIDHLVQRAVERAEDKEN